MNIKRGVSGAFGPNSRAIQKAGVMIFRINEIKAGPESKCVDRSLTPVRADLGKDVRKFWGINPVGTIIKDCITLSIDG